MSRRRGGSAGGFIERGHVVEPGGGVVDGHRSKQREERGEELVGALHTASSKRVILMGGTYALVGQALNISRSVILEADHGPGTVVLDGQGLSRVLSIDAGEVLLVGLNFTRGTAEEGTGGGLLILPQPPVINYNIAHQKVKDVFAVQIQLKLLPNSEV